MKKTAFLLLVLIVLNCFAIGASATQTASTTIPTTFLGRLDIYLDDELYDSSAAFMIKDERDKVQIYSKEYDYLAPSFISLLTMVDSDWTCCKLNVSYSNRKISLWDIDREANEIIGFNVDIDNKMEDNASYVLTQAESRKNQSVTAVYYNSAYAVKQAAVTLKDADDNGFLTIEGNLPELSVFPAALIDTDGHCVGFITDNTDGELTAYAFQFNASPDINYTEIALLVLGILVIVAAVIIIILLLKNSGKKDTSSTQIKDQNDNHTESQEGTHTGPVYPPSDQTNTTVSVDPVYLRGEPGTMYGQEYTVENDAKISVGKHPGDTINFADKSNSVSREHAIIKNRNGQLYVCDCGSTNGTFVAFPGQNVQKLPAHEDTLVPAGSVIYFAERSNGFRVVVK